MLHTSTAPEPFGRVIVEGMLARKPVIATRAGGVCEILVEEDTGIMVPPGEPALLAGAVRRLLGDPVAAERLAASGRDHAENEFTVHAMVQAMTRNMEEVAQA